MRFHLPLAAAAVALGVRTVAALQPAAVVAQPTQSASPPPTGAAAAVEPSSTVEAASTSAPTSSAASASSSAAAGHDSHTFALIMEIVIPVVVVLVGVACALFLLARYKGWTWRGPPAGARSRSRASSVARPLVTSSSRNLTAEQLAGTPASDTAPRRGGRLGRRAAAAAGAGTGTGTGSRRSRQEARRLRRTESGQSVRTLPAYSTQAGEEEVVLFRQRTDSDLDEEDEGGDVEMQHVGTSVTLPAHEQAAQNSADGIDAPGGVDMSDEREALAGLPTVRLSSDSAASSEPSHVGHDAISPRGWGEAPSYAEATSEASTPSLPLPVTTPRRPSQLSFHDAESGLPASQSGFARTTSQIRSFFRTPFAHAPDAPDAHAPPRPPYRAPRASTSSSHLLLTPSLSRLSTPMAARSRAASVSLASPGGSMASLVISPPLPHTAVRASFDARDLPRAGLNVEQMRWMGSSEAVHLAGVQIGNGRRRRSSAAATQLYDGAPSPSVYPPVDDGGTPVAGDAPPPSWAEVDGERRAEQAAVAARLGRPAEQDTEAGEAVGQAHPEAVAGVDTPEAPEAPATAVAGSGRPTLAFTSASTPSESSPASSPPPHLAATA